MKSNKIDRFNIILVDIQLFATVATLIAFIMYMFQTKMFLILCVCVCITLFILAFNNYKIYHKKNYTIIYLVVGIISTILTILSIVGD